MPGLTIGWEYLTGYAVATDPAKRNRAEWPPHPGRLFMAIAAAWFETGEDHAEGEALRWLETLGDPELWLPPLEPCFERIKVTTYVPVNDTYDPYTRPDKQKKATIYPHLGAVAIGRNRQPRTFPRMWVGHQPCFMQWANADGVEKHSASLDRLCAKVTRIGHSSSLVRMWVADNRQILGVTNEPWFADDGLADSQLRPVSPGTLNMLAERFNRSARKLHTELTEQINLLAAQKKAVKGKGAKERKAEVDVQVEELKRLRHSVNPRPPLRPSLGLWSGYRRGDATRHPEERPHSHFDADVLFLAQVDGPQLPLTSTLPVAEALRGAVMRHSPLQPPPAWVNGHLPDGEPLRDDDGHLAFIPLPFVGHEHADGHLLGAGLLFPRSVDRRERGQVLGELLLDEMGQPRPVELKLGRLGVWTAIKRDWSERREALQPETWTAHPDGADTWATVTPLVLDKFPKTDRSRDRETWTREVADIIVAACKRIDLPEPALVDVDSTCWHVGSPRAVIKRRPLRGQSGISTDGEAALGDGFPLYPPKGTHGPRPQVHAWLRFPVPVIGPVLLGAGRYRGYGLCKPWVARQRP